MKILVLSTFAINKTCSKSSLPNPLTKIYSFPVFSVGTIWSKPTSLPGIFPCALRNELLLPPKEPELTTTGLSDSTKAPIILELLETVVL